MRWKTRRKTLDLQAHAVIMGILNATPDSFSDGGKHLNIQNAVEHALAMVADGAAIIDIGGESTRPGAVAVSSSEEVSRTVPIIKALKNTSDVLISIDTSKASVAQAALQAGADIVNDVTGLLGDSHMAEVCIQAEAGVCIMHMQGTPQTMQHSPQYENRGVVATVQDFFEERLATLTSMGMDSECICFDPGIGFGKTQKHNWQLMRHLADLQKKRPILLGVSRKSMIGKMIDETAPEKRDPATATLTALAYQAGIRIHRVHDVRTNIQSLKMAAAMTATI
ncbi:MAG: dihydropteroate synthase [Akkermansiaceae bacterium]